MTDLVAFGDTAIQFSPRGSERLAVTREARIHTSGIESGAAAAATAVGAEGTWVSKLPDSPLGRHAVGQLRQHGVETEIAWTDPDEARQGLVFREVGHAPREEVVRYDCGGTAVASANPGDLPMDLVQSAETVFAGGSTAVLSEQAATTTEAMLRAAGGGGAITVADVDYREGFRSADRYRETIGQLAEHIDVLAVQAEHAETVFGVSGRSRELAHTLTAEYDLGTVVVTQDDCSAVALRDTPGTNVAHEQGAVGVDIVDATGRQAAFVGGLLGRLARGDDLPRALVDAVAAAALACTVPGSLLSATRGEIDGVVARMRAG